jgi:hypothetical protein
MRSESFMLPATGMRATLLDAVVAIDNGAWVNVQGMEKMSFHILIANTATAQVRASNEPNPLPTDDGGLVEQVTVSAYVQLRAPARWVKVKVSAHTSGAVSAYMEAIP